ncbi:DHH family phosphoesterase [Candidatus Saccharibacteria bacterium]|nr:DHH family phosphoesterase [Candidatus Saccharibacteria bacterium]MCL1963153.1 DHH family phosphoesterase [Candidatus Saccharibacteria bacterium]
MTKKIPELIKKILVKRGWTTVDEQHDFLNPDYEKSKHDPFLLPDMKIAVGRILAARDSGEKVTIYGDYDIDGMTATTILWDSFRQFGIDVATYTPDRFTEGYGLNIDAVEAIVADGTKLIITVDNGSLSFDEVARANELGVDVIITDHHTPHATLPDAVAVLNPKILVRDFPDSYDENLILKRNNCHSELVSESKKILKQVQDDKIGELYPFADLCGAGVAFKLVQALQSSSEPDLTLPPGQEKWLLDLVALGTVCDVVGLVDENRAYVKWGLEVLKKTRCLGLKALMAVAGVDQKNIDARALGFMIGPRLNAAGRMETAEIALELLKTDDNMRALQLAEKLEQMNKERRKVQDEIFISACEQVIETDPVAITVGDDWHEGVIGIVAAKILEKFERPAFVMSRGAEFSKASGRSFGQFSIAAAIHATDELLIKGGGHLAAGGLTIETTQIDTWYTAVQDFYKSQNLTNQKEFLYPKPDVTIDNFADFTPELLTEITKLEPFGQRNPAPVFEISPVLIMSRRTMGDSGQHVRYVFADSDGRKFNAVAFNASDKFTLSEFDDNDEPQRAKILIELTENNWNDRISVEGRLIRLEPVAKISDIC